MSSGLEGELMGVWSLGLGAVGVVLAGVFLANSDLCLSKAERASMDHLKDAELRSTDDGSVIRAQSLWERSGAVVMVVRRPG